MDKNRDLLFQVPCSLSVGVFEMFASWGFARQSCLTNAQDLAQFMYSCKHSLAKTLFKEGKLIGSMSTTKRPPTLATQFRASISGTFRCLLDSSPASSHCPTAHMGAELMKNLLAKNPHYIRCMKPNDRKLKGTFDDELVRHQVRYLGLMENIRVRRAGFAFRLEYDRFLARFKMLSKLTWPKFRGNPRDGVKQVRCACIFHWFLF